jgi:diacylglycerol kinase (ATP)
MGMAASGQFTGTVSDGAQAGSSSKNLLLAVNRNASGVAEPAAMADRATAALRARGASVEARVTETPDELDELLAAADGRRVVLLGGDGTLHVAVNRPRPRPELALLPAGGANNIAASLGIPVELAAAAALAVEGRPRRIDLIGARCGERYCVGIEGVSVGFHAVARARYRARNSSEVWAAVRAAATALPQFRGSSVVIETDGVVRGSRIAQLFVANLPLYGFELLVAPHASAEDGMLDVVVWEWRGRAALIPLFVRLRRGGTEAIAWTGRRIHLDTGESPLICDTTDLGRGRAEITVLPGELALVAPQG